MAPQPIFTKLYNSPVMAKASLETKGYRIEAGSIPGLFEVYAPNGGRIGELTSNQLCDIASQATN